MSVIRKTTSVTVLAVALAAMWIWLGGCDFSPVDEGAAISADAHVSAIASATDADNAEKAIRQLFAKIGATEVERPGMSRSEFFGFAMSDGKIKDLAAAQARYNLGDESAGYALTSIYEVLDEPLSLDGVFARQKDGIAVELVDALVALQAAARRATENPETPVNALLLAVVSDRDGTPAEVPLFGLDKVLSPVQGVLLGMWLYVEGDNIPTFSFDEAVAKGGPPSHAQSTCPAGEVLISKYEWYGSYVFEKGDRDAVSMAGNARSAEWASTVPINTVIIKGGTNRDYVTYSNGANSGAINKNQVGNKDISHVVFCGGKTPPDSEVDCYDKCNNKYLINKLACKYSSNKEECMAQARETARQCGNSCHDQGHAAPGWWSF